jgi:hypothetical protein
MSRKIENPSGVIDGVNAIFTTSAPYDPGSLGVWLNGQQILGGYAETSPALGTFTITDANCVPKAGVWGADALIAEYWDGVDEVEVLVVDELAATIADQPIGMNCTIQEVDQIAATIQDAPVGVTATIQDVDVIACHIADAPTGIDCTIQEC